MLPACNVCGVVYSKDYEGPCQEFAPSTTISQVLSGRPRACPGSISLVETLDRKLVELVEDLREGAKQRGTMFEEFVEDTLADAGLTYLP
jgi:hypothetical protein